MVWVQTCLPSAVSVENRRTGLRPRPPRCQPMTADQPTPGEGDRPDGIDYEMLAERLLESELQMRGGEVRGVFHEVASKAREGEPITESDVLELRDAVEQAAILVGAVEQAHPAFEEVPE